MLTPEQAGKLDARLFEGDECADADAGTATPETIGGYRIVRTIGAGGMGVVYEAEQERPRRHVAIKVLRPGVVSRPALERFEREVEVLGRLRHPGVAQIFDAGFHDDQAGRTPFFVMELVEGGTAITAFAASRGSSLRERLELFAAACDAVHHGHQKGVIHRDLKPENILVATDDDPDASPQVKVIDFGIARSTDVDRTVTLAEGGGAALVGTLQYMSPEQCALEGEPLDLDIRSDVYSLGVVLFELLTGRVPYDLSHASLPTAIRLIAEVEPEAPSTLRRDLRGPFETIICCAMAKDREARYGSAAALAEDVRRLLRGDPIDAQPLTRWQRTARWIGRHPIVTTTAACVAIAVITVVMTVVTVWWYARRPHHIELADDLSEARVMSIGRHVVHAWSASAGRIRFGFLTQRPPERGGGRVAIVGFDTMGRTRYGGACVAFDLDGDLDEPLWSGAIADGDLPDRAKDDEVRASEFGVRYGAIRDIFPEVPGDEIVVSYIHADSWAALRVYAMDGEVLFQAWHDGHVIDWVWLAEPRTLVLTGINAEGLWGRRGLGDRDRGMHPRIIFAIRPMLGDITRDFIRTGDAGTRQPLWSHALLPGESGDAVAATEVSRPGPFDDPRTEVVLTVLLRGDREAAMNLHLDRHGREVERHPNNGYRSLAAAGLAPDRITLGPLPPLVQE